MKLKATARYGVPFILGGLIFLLVSSGFFFYRGQKTLINLLTHGQNIHATTVYGRWWDLSDHSPLTWTEMVETLRALEYTEVQHDPLKPGQYLIKGSMATVYLHEFQYPDGVFSAQKVRLYFSKQRIDKVETFDPVKNTTWRLEPKLLAQWGVEDALSRRQIRLADLPPYIPQAIVAIEDKRFYRHGAFDVVGMLRAVFVDMRHARLSQGASTISQQLARSIFLSTRRTLSRKLLEAVLAAYLEVRFSKEQLLEMYLNQVYWGQDGASSLIGIDAASHAYFGKSPRDISVSDAALLAGLLQSPNHYSPRNIPELAYERRDLVLRLMHSQHLITTAVYNQSRAERIRLVPAAQRVNEAAYFLAFLQDSLEERYGGVELPTAGWTIFTPLDPVLEHAAVVSLQKLSHPKGQAVHPEAALIAMEPKTGALRAWVGGTNYLLAPYDRAIHAHRQPGSAFKPFVMLAALDKHVATTATVLKDEPLTLKTADGPWSPQNYDRQYRHHVLLWDALIHSLNIPTVILAQQTGFAAIAEYAHRAGIQSPISIYPAMALGASEVTLLELTNAYATFAAEGIYQPVYMVESIVDAHGQVLETHAPDAHTVFDPLSVALITKMLQAVLTEGTGAASHAMGLTYPLAGKTGTSENFQDAWFVGYSPTLVCGVWVGYDKPKSLGHAAAGIALPLWAPFMQKAIFFVGDESFPEHKNIVWKTIDADNGLLVRSGCPNRKTLPFLPGTEPTALCPDHAGGLVGFFHRLVAPHHQVTSSPVH